MYRKSCSSEDQQTYPLPDTSTSESDTSNTTPSDIDYKKDIFTVGATQLETQKGNKWYYKESSGISAITYVDSYDISDDTTIVTNAYLDMYDVILSLPYKGIYYFTWAKEDGTVVGSAFKMSINGVGSTSMPIVWAGEFASLNDSAVSNLYSSTWTSSDSVE